MRDIINRFRSQKDAAREHPVISSVVEGCTTAKKGVVEAVTGENEKIDAEEISEEAWGPVDGPAPTEETERSSIVTFNIEYGGYVEEATVQFWMPRNGGAILGAWNVNGQSGDSGVFIKNKSEFWLGAKPFYSETGEKFVCIELTDEIKEQLWTEFKALMQRHQTQVSGITRQGFDDEYAGKIDEKPAPVSFNCSDTIDATVSSNSSEIPARFQLWTTESSGAVYVAWEVGDQSGDYGILHASGIWLGKDEQLTSPCGVTTPFLFINDQEIKDQFDECVSKIQEEVDGEYIEAKKYIDTVESNHPSAPGQDTQLSDEM